MPSQPLRTTATGLLSRRAAAIGLVAFWALARTGRAQPAMQSIANSSNSLPLRNLQIELRQVQAQQREQGGAEVDGARVQTTPGGGAQAQLGLRLGQRQEQLSGTTTQMALVINGHSTSIALRSSRSYRLMQTQFHQGRPMLVPGAVVLETSTGFMATPRWDGSDQVELDINSSQAGLSSGMQGTPAGGSGSLASSLLLPLGEWVTIAQSTADRSASRSSLLGQSSESEQSSSELQVRITVR